MSIERLISSCWTDLYTSTGSSPNLVLPAPMISGEWKSNSVTAKEIRDGLLYETNLVLKFFHFLLASLVLIVSLTTSPPSILLNSSILPYLVYYMYLHSWNGASSKTRKFWEAILHPHFLVHVIFLATYRFPAAQTCFTTYCFVHVLFVRLSFHPHISCFLRDPFDSTRVRIGIILFTINIAILWILQSSDLDMAFVFVSGAACVTVATGVLALIAQSITRTPPDLPYTIYSPLIDLAISLRSVLEFRSSVGLSISAFLRLLVAHIDPSKIWCDPTITLDTLIEWLSHEKGVAVWRFLAEFKTYRLNRISDPSTDSAAVPQDILDTIEAGRRERWLTNPQNDGPFFKSTPLLRNH